MSQSNQYTLYDACIQPKADIYIYIIELSITQNFRDEFLKVFRGLDVRGKMRIYRTCIDIYLLYVCMLARVAMLTNKMISLHSTDLKPVNGYNKSCYLINV